jgi:U6 snRNA-associated Sm-like protein LSm1
VVILRDGRKFFGLLRSFDQYGNLVLTDTFERYYVDLEYAEEYRGVYLIRGENVCLVGELVILIYNFNDVLL